MINPKFLYKLLSKNDVRFFAGVPDSLLKNFCAYITDNCKEDNHVIAANEGNAVAIGIGYYLSTKKVPMIYMQNSGLGNIVNPVLSLADSDVYSIPMILMIGWRGEPNIIDEPQHKKQGRITLNLLNTMEIPYIILDKEDSDSDLERKIGKIINTANSNKKPVAIVIKKNSFEKYNLKKEEKSKYDMTREDAIKSIVDQISDKDIVVSTTGVTSRELFEYRELKKQSHRNDFYTVGGMGHANQIALGIAMQNKSKNILCLDGDGALIMHMGSAAIIGQQKCDNFKHILFNNGCHDSVGGQPTVGYKINLQKIAKSMNYSLILESMDLKSLKSNFKKLMQHKGSAFLEIKVKKGYRNNLGRPTTTPLENKKALMNFLEK